MRARATTLCRYAPWCSHCQEAKPAFGAAADRLRAAGSPVELAAVDCTADQSTCVEMGIAEYPTFLAFPRGGDETVKGHKYNGERDPGSFEREGARIGNMA
jgi:thiol-disulfide isomerase/thioredoxin